MAGPGTKGLLPLLGPDPGSPRDLHLVGRYALGVNWQDGHGSIYPFAQLRKACPCPACRTPDPDAIGAPDPEAAWPVEIRREPGALEVRWQDGHTTTIPYGDLRRECRCAACTGAHG